MPYAKTSLRAEQRALREKMRALGMSHRQIAVEFARRYQLRPRAAWRHAYGWSQTEAAEQISTYAAHAGLGPDGTTVTMTGPHLCEYENWPGEGPDPPAAGPLLTCCRCSLPCTGAPCTTCSTWPTTSTCPPPTGSLSASPRPPTGSTVTASGRRHRRDRRAPQAKSSREATPLSPAAGQLTASSEAAGSVADSAELPHSPGGRAGQPLLHSAWQCRWPARLRCARPPVRKGADPGGSSRVEHARRMGRRQQRGGGHAGAARRRRPPHRH